MENINKKGISLIVLIITIIVVIILAAVVILTLSKNNPIESAREAKFKEDVRTFQDELALSVSKDYTNKAGQRDYKFTATRFDKIKEYIPSFNENYKGKFVIKNDNLVYNEDKLNENELKYVSGLNITKNIKTGAEVVEDDPKNIYGERITNYSSNGVSDWKIFYSDGSNIYLITSQYIDLDKLPPKNEKTPNTGVSGTKSAKFLSLLNEYAGSNNITDERIKALNYDYFITNKFSSSNYNMKAVAYMLDIEIWSVFAEGLRAEYAIGGATIEMLMDSYSQKKNMECSAKAMSSEGYQISNDGGKSWKYSFSITDNLYVLPQSAGAKGMWISSPYYSSKGATYSVRHGGQVCDTSYSYSNGLGFRPIVCLKSDTMLKKVEGGYEIE